MTSLEFAHKNLCNEVKKKVVGWTEIVVIVNSVCFGKL